MHEITGTFLESMGWVLIETYPLYKKYEHNNNTDLILTIGAYGMFSLTELHWINKTPERVFSTIGKTLTPWDYMEILRLIGISIPGKAHEIKPKGKKDIELALILLREIEAFLSFNLTPPEEEIKAMKNTIREFISSFPECWECGDAGYTGNTQDYKCKKCNNV